MLIPKAFTLGRTHYNVYQPDTLSYSRRGFIDYNKRVIYVAKASPVLAKPYTAKQRSDTYWHEVTHAVLHDMGHPLSHNETFVDEFSKRLSQTIRSAVL